jgi:hypothetical protein
MPDDRHDYIENLMDSLREPSPPLPGSATMNPEELKELLYEVPPTTAEQSGGPFPCFGAMKSTTLNFLTTDGPLTVTFTPVLTPKQYELLYDTVATYDSQADLAEALKVLGRSWRCEVVVDLC